MRRVLLHRGGPGALRTAWAWATPCWSDRGAWIGVMLWLPVTES